MLYIHKTINLQKLTSYKRNENKVKLRNYRYEFRNKGYILIQLRIYRLRYRLPNIYPFKNDTKIFSKTAYQFNFHKLQDTF